MSKPNAKNTLLISDMTGTILYQQEGGFPLQSQKLLLQFLKQGGTFILVTGDSLETAKRCVWNKLLELDSTLNKTAYFITANGYQLTEMNKARTKVLYQGKPLELEFKKLALKRFEVLLSEFFETSFSFTSNEWDQFLQGDGAQIFIQDRLPGLQESLGVECVPNKVTVCFFDRKGDLDLRKKLVNCFLHDQALKSLTSEHQLHTISGNEFVDFINCTKADGIRKFFELKGSEVQAQQAFVVGDSPNDKGLFEFNYPIPNQNIYVGPDQEYFDLVVNAKKKGVFLAKEHTQGFFKVLSEMIIL